MDPYSKIGGHKVDYPGSPVPNEQIPLPLQKAINVIATNWSQRANHLDWDRAYDTHQEAVKYKAIEITKATSKNMTELLETCLFVDNEITQRKNKIASLERKIENLYSTGENRQKEKWNSLSGKIMNLNKEKWNSLSGKIMNLNNEISILQGSRITVLTRLKENIDLYDLVTEKLGIVVRIKNFVGRIFSFERSTPDYNNALEKGTIFQNAVDVYDGMRKELSEKEKKELENAIRPLDSEKKKGELEIARRPLDLLAITKEYPDQTFEVECYLTKDSNGGWIVTNEDTRSDKLWKYSGMVWNGQFCDPDNFVGPKNR